MRGFFPFDKLRVRMTTKNEQRQQQQHCGSLHYALRAPVEMTRIGEIRCALRSR
jgi:hypothetical protein